MTRRSEAARHQRFNDFVIRVLAKLRLARDVQTVPKATWKADLAKRRHAKARPAR